MNLETLFTYFGHFTSYFDRLLHLDNGRGSGPTSAEWFWGLEYWLRLLGETLLIAYVGTLLGAVGAFALNFLAADNTSPRHGCASPCAASGILPHRARHRLRPDLRHRLRPRADGRRAGVAIHSIGALGKLFSEVVENTDMKPVEGVRSTGATGSSPCASRVLPQIDAGSPATRCCASRSTSAKPRSWASSARAASARTLVEAIRKFYYSDVCAILLMIVVTVFIIDIGTGWLRGRLFGREAHA